jgi:uncharacterized membrane protein
MEAPEEHLATHDPTSTPDPGDVGARLTHPVVTAIKELRQRDLQLRAADAITTFAGSMIFVYIHAALFVVWMIFAEGTPWPTLTLVVSLEAIFLSTFVLIGQNRQAEFQLAKADHDFVQQELELQTNTDLTRAIHVMTTELHRRATINQEGAHHVS